MEHTLLACLLALLTAPLQVVPHPPGVTSLISLDVDGASSDGISINTSLSNDGRFVAFQSEASDLVAGDTNSATDAFVRDRLLGTTVRVSVSVTGVQVTKGGRLPVISGDGTKVLFVSESSFLAPDDTNMSTDVIVRDLLTGTNALASVNSAGIVGDQTSGPADLSYDGRFVAFASQSANLVTGDDNDLIDVFVRDMELGLTERISEATDGTQANGDSGDMAITPDGRFVSFSSSATNLVADDVGLQTDVFVRDRALGTTELVSRAPDGTPGLQDSFFSNMSADGRYVTFMSRSSNFVPGDTNLLADIFVKDRLTGEIELVSVGWQGELVLESSDSPDITADGRFVVFGSTADNLIPPPPAGASDHHEDHEIFLRDRLLGTTRQISLTPDGKQADSGSITACITPDGAFIGFETYASNLASAPPDTNGKTDIVLHDLSPWTDLGGGLAGTAGVPTLTGHGLLNGLTDGDLQLAGAVPFAPTLLLASLQSSEVPFKGGVLVAFPFLVELPLVADDAGELFLSFTWPMDVPSDTKLWFQALLQDAGAVEGVAISTTLAAVTP